MTPEQEGARCARCGEWDNADCDSDWHVDRGPAPEQEAGEGVARTHARFEECRKVEKLIEAGKLAEAVELAQDRAETVWNDLADIHAAVETAPAPSPHEGEAARGDRCPHDGPYPAAPPLGAEEARNRAIEESARQTAEAFDQLHAPHEGEARPVRTAYYIERENAVYWPDEINLTEARRQGYDPREVSIREAAPTEGEAARCDREWTIYVCPGCDWVSGDPDDDPNCRCSCGEHEEPPPIRAVTVRETAPTEPRSISEEALGVQIGRVERLRDQLLDHVAMPRRLDGAALDALLAAYEQEKARADAAEQRADQAEDDHWPYEWQVATAEREKRKKAEAERDTAQASEARLRERMDELIEAVREWAAAEWPGGVKQASQFDADDRDRRVLVALAALASTPNPEERACTCPPSAFTGYYTPANSCPRHGSAPDPTPEPEEGREWTLARLNGDGHLTKWDVIEDEELHRAVLSDPLWEVVTVREAAPTDPTTEEGTEEPTRSARLLHPGACPQCPPVTDPETGPREPCCDPVHRGAT